MPTLPRVCPLYLPAFVLIALVLPARAELTWKQKTVQVKADASMGVVEVRFPFTNGGTNPVDVKQVESSCGCTTTELEQRHYEPGQGGEIVARYTFGNHVGLQHKTIAVKTSDRSEPVILELVADIPEMVRIEPPHVTWSKGEEKKAKSVVLETVNDLVFEDIDLQSTNPAMKAELTTLVKGRKYQITVTPASTAGFAFATLNIRCKFGKELTRTFYSYATVKPMAAGDD